MGTKYAERVGNVYQTSLHLTVVIEGQVKKSNRHQPLVAPTCPAVSL